MTAIGDLLTRQDRDKLLARLRQLQDLAVLVRKIPDQQAPGEPPTLMELSATTTGRNA